MKSKIMDFDYKLYLLEGMCTDTSTKHGKIFMQMLGLRIEGYKKHYGFKVMPIDMYDHFSKHLVLSKSTSDGEKLLACVRFVNLNDCRKHGIVFLPLARVLADPKNESLTDSVRKLIDDSKQKNLYYNSSLTISPFISIAKKKKAILKKIIGSALNYHRAIGSENWLTSAPVKVRTDKLFQRIGYEPFCENPYYLLKTLNNEKTIIFRHIHKNEAYTEWLSGARKLWNNVTIIK